MNLQSTTGTPLNAYGAPGAYTALVAANSSPGAGWGLYIVAGDSAATVALAIVNTAQTLQGMVVDGAMRVKIPVRLQIPVGTDYWLT